MREPITIREPARAQRVDARGRLAVGRTGARTRIVRLFQEGAAKIRLPRVAADPLEAVLINTAGGLTGGDRLGWEIDADAGAALCVTTQACERIYRAGTGEAAIDVRMTVGPGARLAWLPQETILFDRSALTRKIAVDLDASSELLMLEATIFGRTAMGETVGWGTFRDRWRIRAGGRLIHAEEFRMAGDVAAVLARAAVANGAAALATLLLVGEAAEERLAQVRAIIGDDGAASAWRVGPTGKLLARLCAPDGYHLRRRLVPLVALLNREAAVPRIWST